MTRVLLLGVVLITMGCAGVVRPPVSPRSSAEPPRIVAPTPTKRLPLIARADKEFRSDVRMRLPARDGDPIVVVFNPRPQRALKAEDVRDEIIAPILRAIGFTPGLAALRMPPSGGVPLPAPSFAPLAQAVALEYASHPKLLRPETRKMLDVFLGRQPADEEVDHALQLGEGMTFAQFKAGIERREILFPFVQVHGNVSIEHATLIASAWDGETVRSVQGSLLTNYAVANSVTLDPGAAVPAARRALVPLGVQSRTRDATIDAPQLVLLPYGSDERGVARLRYAYRMQLEATWQKRAGLFLLWADADTGAILALEPMLSKVGASGRAFPRDPGVAGTVSVPFEVNPASRGVYALGNGSVAARLDYGGDGYTSADVSIGATGNGSSAAFANFDQAPLNTPAGAVCQTGGNTRLPQVDLFATMMRQRETILGGGIFTPFPPFQWTPQIVPMDEACYSDYSMYFGECPGYRHAGCPDWSDGTTDQVNLLSFAHDHSIVGHEVGHTATWTSTQSRPPGWCNPPPGASCTPPLGWGQFHDLADFWGAHLESTNCIAGWVAKNMNGSNASRYCAQHDEGGWYPRLLDVTAGSVGGDHFPEHRADGANAGDYADGQIAGAALWQVRAGMRSKCRPSGVPQFGVRFQRALMHAGFFTAQEPGSSDLGTYQRLHELLFKLVEQWVTAGSPGGLPAFAHNGAHTANKVTAGFARAGLFLVFPACLEPDATGDPSCPTTSPGADAVIDVDDADPDDDEIVDGVRVVDRDFLRLGGPPPIFHVWTGPRYRLDGAQGKATMTTTAPCNATFQVEVATDDAFTTAFVASGWIDVNRDPTTAAETQCYGAWSPDATQWARLQGAAGQPGGLPARIYYRARTRDAAGGTERLSTQPGNGLWTVPPPYAVITADGRSDY